jgi:hypothetical protein
MTSHRSPSRLLLVLLTVVIFSATAHAQTLKFAWPDGASAKVQARSQGRRTIHTNTRNWDMTCEFTMGVQRTADRVVISREGFSGWKGTFPPSLGGGPERFVDMIPITIVSTDGMFIGIEGQETARKQITHALEQSGTLHPVIQAALQSLTSDASLEAMAAATWAALVGNWRDIDLDPAQRYAIRDVVPLPHLGSVKLDAAGTIRFIKETACTLGPDDRRCVELLAEISTDQEQANKLLKSMLQKAGANDPRVTGFEQRFKVSIVVDKRTMLPQQLTMTRLQSVQFESAAQSFSEDVTKTMNFAWVLKQEDKRSSP